MKEIERRLNKLEAIHKPALWSVRVYDLDDLPEPSEGPGPVVFMSPREMSIEEWETRFAGRLNP